MTSVDSIDGYTQNHGSREDRCLRSKLAGAMQAVEKFLVESKRKPFPLYDCYATHDLMDRSMDTFR